MKKKEKKYGLLKGILFLMFVAIICTWLIPNAQYQGSTFATDNALARVGLNDLPWLLYYAFYFVLDKIVLLLAIGGFYGVLTRTKVYERVVSGIAKKIKKQKAFVIVMSVLIAALTSFLTQTLVVLIFIPFVISIMNRMKLDKMTILATTFGSMLVGILGATYGTEGLVFLTGYFSGDKFNANSTILIRAGILLLGLVLFNFFTITHMSKVDKDAKSVDMFPVEIEDNPEDKNKKKPNMIPFIVVGVVLFLLSLVAFTNWKSWSVFTSFDEEQQKTVTVFNKFNDSVMDIKIGEDFYVFKSILGSNMPALGDWDTFAIAVVVFLATVVISLCYRTKFDEFIDGFMNGAKKMIKPILVVVGAFFLVAVVYMSPFMPFVANKLLTLTDGFNLVTMSLTALIFNILHSDLGFTGYLIGSYLSAEYVDYINSIYVIFTSLYGYVQFFIPTSIFLGIGLVSLDVKYKDWLKYIFKFLVGMLICLLVIFILMTII